MSILPSNSYSNNNSYETFPTTTPTTTTTVTTERKGTTIEEIKLSSASGIEWSNKDAKGSNHSSLVTEVPQSRITFNTTFATLTHKKVEFNPQIQMDSSKEVKAESHPKSETESSANAITTTAANTSSPAPILRRRSSPTGNLLQEIRKMSLASQDAAISIEEKKSSKKLSLRKLFGKRRKRREEEYTDKDRAAAVTLGSRDIKLSLKAKKKRERKLCLSLELMNSEDFLTEMLMHEALLQIRRKKIHEAIETLNKALELQPHHKGALVARSQCYLKLGNATLALRDAELSLDNCEEKTFVFGLLQYAEALYSLGRFEQALIEYHRGYRLRRDVQDYRIGIQKCQDAINRAIGDNSATKIDNLDDILPVIDKMKAMTSHEIESPFEDDLESHNNSGTKLKKEHTNQSNRIAREVLGQIYSDKDYFTKFLKRSEIQKDQDTAYELRHNAKEALNYLQVREKFWRQQNPIYARHIAYFSHNNSSVLKK